MASSSPLSFFVVSYLLNGLSARHCITASKRPWKELQLEGQVPCRVWNWAESSPFRTCGPVKEDYFKFALKVLDYCLPTAKISSFSSDWITFASVSRRREASSSWKNTILKRDRLSNADINRPWMIKSVMQYFASSLTWQLEVNKRRLASPRPKSLEKEKKKQLNNKFDTYR